MSTRSPARLLFASAFVAGIALFSPLSAQTIVPQSALTPYGGYYTDLVGGGIGNVVVMTGGGNAPGVGLASGRNDDGFSGPINFGYTLNFFGNNYTQFYANNNGNISFGAGISAFVPTGPTGAASPVISAWFADVDTRGTLSGVLHIRQDVANETILTWDQVGRYNGQDDLLNSFQMIIRGPSYSVPNGEGSIGFFYKKMPWETTSTSQTAAVGFGDGSGNSEVLAGSTVPGLNTVVQDHYIWFDQNLVVVPPTTNAPEPSTYVLMLSGLGAIAVAARRRRRA
ncbi:MAG: nidogen-like domain-containing protein [Gemmatimonas sp.]